MRPQAPRKLDITTAWTTEEGMPSIGVMSLSYVTNLRCAVPDLRSRLAADTPIGAGKSHLIPEELIKIDRKTAADVLAEKRAMRAQQEHGNI